MEKIFKKIFLILFSTLLVWLINQSKIYKSPTLAQDVIYAGLVRKIDTSSFGAPALNPAPDPAGITFIPTSNHLLISDSEVEEMAIYNGSNLFEITLTGDVIRTANTLSFSHEPTGVTYSPETGHFYFTDDDARRINDLDPGSDGFPGTSDDKVTYLSSTTICSTIICSNDPEGIGYGQNSLFIASGTDHRIFRINYNGTLINSFDTSSLGANDIEGVAYNSNSQSLYILDQTSKKIIHTDTNGNLISTININSADPVLPGDLTFAPSSDPNDSSSIYNLYIADRGVDNNSDPTENDGKIYEMSLPQSNQTPTPTPACPADLNKNGTVDIADFRQVLNFWSLSCTVLSSGCPENIIIDGKINTFDLALVIKNWGICP